MDIKTVRHVTINFMFIFIVGCKTWFKFKFDVMYLFVPVWTHMYKFEFCFRQFCVHTWNVFAEAVTTSSKVSHCCCIFELNKKHQDDFLVYSEDVIFFVCLRRTCFGMGSGASGSELVCYSKKTYDAQFFKTLRLKMNIQIQSFTLGYIHP